MLHASIEALFGRNRDGHRTKHIFQLRRRHNDDHKNEHDELSKFFLEKPHLEKTLIHDTTFAFASMQGWRSTMEDKHKHLIPLDKYAWKLWSYFAIFDGHNGKRNGELHLDMVIERILFKGIDTAKHASEQLHIHLLDTLNHMLQTQHDSRIKVDGSYLASNLDLDKLYNAIKRTYFELDKDLRRVVKDHSGCVCVRMKDIHFFNQKFLENI